MRHVVAWLLPVALLLVPGCGDDSASSSTAATTTVAGPDCPEPREIYAVEDLLDELLLMEWPGSGPYSSGLSPITADLVISGTLALDASAISVPGSCRGRSDCSPQAALVLSDGVTGAVGEGDANLECAESYGRVLLTDTTVRLRVYLRDTHPCRYNYVPTVEVLPACGTPCAAGQQMCPADGVCYQAGDTYCRHCEGGSRQACACRGPEGPRAEGSSCTYWESGDVRCDGVCRDGSCDAGPCP